MINEKVLMNKKKFLNNLSINHGEHFEYVSGYVHSDSAVIVRCKHCGLTMEKNAQFARKNKCTTCIHCDKARREEEERVRLLRKKILKQAERTTRAVYEIKLGKCGVCDSYFSQDRRGQRFCSNHCSNRHANRMKEIRKRKLRGNITLNDVVKKENNVCYLCNKECDSSDYKLTNDGHFIVGKYYPSIEHVIPISKGGKHVWDNIKLAHHYCNTLKNDKEIFIVK